MLIPNIKNPEGIAAKIKYFNADEVLNLLLRSNPTKI